MRLHQKGFRALRSVVRHLVPSRRGRRFDPAAAAVNTQTALQCCFRIAVDNGDFANVEAIRHRHAADRPELSVRQLIDLAPEFELVLEPRRLSWDDLARVRFGGPVILILDNRNAVVVQGVVAGDGADRGERRIAVFDPLDETQQTLFLPRPLLEQSWSGLALLSAQKGAAIGEPQQSFGFSWFTRKLFTDRGVMRDILVAALIMHLVALSVPIFFQILLDKVLPNRAMATLVTLTIGVGVLLVFDSVFNYLRNYLLAHVTRKFDLSVSNETVEHMLSLPIDYFHRNPAGVVVHKLSEATNVREFLASRLFNTFLDLTAIVVILPVLCVYSLILTAFVLAVSVLSFIVLMVAAKRFRRELEEANIVEARRKGLLVELIHGIATVKTLAIEGHCNRRWRRLSADSANRGLDLGKTAAAARAILTSMEKTVPVLIGAVGVLLVLDGQITVGALVAFNMLGARVSGPLIHSASLLQEYQKAALSLRILSDLMRTPPEPRTGQLVPEIRGAVELENVSFHYPGQSTPALDGVSLKIAAGQTVGIVGPSGSGKTTVTRLAQGLYQPQSGIVRIDGHDIKELDTNYLRSRIGVVLQDNFFFRGTVRENIALAQPDSSLSEVMRACEMAGAHEFVQHLPQGYATMLEENAGNLSGGQRQRLAIARVLLKRPPLLILDEATSSLDPESEAVVRASLRTIRRGRTMIIVTHRLSFVRDADVIIVLDRGRLVGSGGHDRLIKECLPYRQFWNQQARAFA